MYKPMKTGSLQAPNIGVNIRDADGSTPLHIASNKLIYTEIVRPLLHKFNVHELSIFIKCVGTVRHSLNMNGKFATTVRALTQDQFDKLIDIIHEELNLRCAELDNNLDTEPDAYISEEGSPWDQSITRAVYAFANIDYYDP